MIIDAFPFFNEIQLLNVRLRYLGPYVDKFILIESTIDFSGKSRELMLTDEFISNLPFSQKIEVIHWKPNPFYFKWFIDFSAAVKYRKGLWLIQHLQRNSLLGKIEKYDPNDILIFGDLDEFPDATFISDINNFNHLLTKNKIHIFEQIMYYYNIYSIMDSSWRGTILTNVATARELTPRILRKYRLDYPVCARGWHFSYFADAQRIKTKIQAIADVEKLGNFKSLSTEEIAFRVTNSIDLYDRSDVKGIFEKKPDIPQELISLIKEFLPNCV